MRLTAQALAFAAALAAFPAFADQEQHVVPGSERDPFSQTYTGRDPDEARAERERERERERPKGSPCDRTCACGHGAAQEHEKA